MTTADELDRVETDELINALVRRWRGPVLVVAGRRKQTADDDPEYDLVYRYRKGGAAALGLAVYAVAKIRQDMSMDRVVV